MQLRVFVKIGRQQGIAGWDGDRLTVVIDAPPVDGAANRRLIEIISARLGVSKSSIKLSKGLTSRYKTLDVDIEEEALKRHLDELPKLPKQEKLF
jgi:uncharacterized protein (TIGR00251 family)